MMKKQIIFGVALAALVAGADVCVAKGLSFSKVELAQSHNIMEWDDDRRESLDKAMAIHNLMRDIRKLKDVERQLSVTEQMRQLEEKRLSALEKCSIDKLGEQFKNPKEVWDKMNAEYARREKELAIYVNSATEPTPEEEQSFLEYFQTGKMTPEMVAEQYAPWRIGQEILMDVYQNQDKWGERKDPKAASFPLWQDQKYVFDQEWDDYYKKVNAYFGVAPEGRPNIGDAKYDYAKYEDIQKAHKEYLASLSATKSSKPQGEAPDLKNPPKAPRPLPPKDEMMIYFGTETPEASIYPALPEPWQKYAENGFKNIDPSGEMAADFKEGLVLKEEAKTKQQTNRLAVYADYKQSVDGMNNLEEVSEAGGDAALGKVYAKLEKYIDISPDENLLDATVREKVLDQLKAKKKELLLDAEQKLASRTDDKEEMVPMTEWDEDDEDFAELKKINPQAIDALKEKMPMSVYEQDEILIKALKKDMDGSVYLNEVNAGDVDKLLKENAAKREFFDESDTIEKMLADANNISIDETCLNGGI